MLQAIINHLSISSISLPYFTQYFSPRILRSDFIINQLEIQNQSPMYVRLGTGQREASRFFFVLSSIVPCRTDSTSTWQWSASPRENSSLVKNAWHCCVSLCVCVGDVVCVVQRMIYRDRPNIALGIIQTRQAHLCRVAPYCATRSWDRYAWTLMGRRISWSLTHTHWQG